MVSRKTRRILIIPTGIHSENVKLLFKVVGSEPIVLAVYLNDGKYMDKKMKVLDSLKRDICELFGYEFKEIGLRDLPIDLCNVKRVIEELKPNEIFLSAVTGPRMLLTLLASLLLYVPGEKYLIMGIEGEKSLFTVKITSLFGKPAAPRSLQLRLLKLMAEKKVLRVQDAARELGVSTSTLYKSLTGLIRRGLVEVSGRGEYTLTYIGKILSSCIVE